MSFLALLAILVISFRYGGLLAGSYFTWLTLRKQIVDILPTLKGRGFLLQDAHVRAREYSWRR